MKRAHLLLASLALFPVSAFVSAQPAMAQANCNWVLDGEWVGERSTNRVMIEMRPGGFVVWVPGQPKPGQKPGPHFMRQAHPSEWEYIYPDGRRAYFRLENSKLRVVQPTFQDVFRPLKPPKCVPIAGAAKAPSPPAPSKSRNTAAPVAVTSDFDLALAAERRGDYVTADRLYRRACHAGIGNACANAGILAKHGKLGASNISEAALLYGMGCDFGSAASCFNLGALYEYGEGRPKSPSTALALYQKVLTLRPNQQELDMANAGIARIRAAQQPPQDRSPRSIRDERLRDNTGGS